MREVYNDDFWIALQEYSLKCSPCTILEIGGGTGDGSTTAYEKAYSNGSKVYSTEIKLDRFNQLKEKPFVTEALFGSSVSIDGYMTKQQVIDFYNSTPTNLNNNSLEVVLYWWEEGMNEVKNSPQNIIKDIKAEFVVIDGSPFTGEAELRATIDSAKIIALDDINDIKNWTNYQFLLDNKLWKLSWQNWWLRNGAAIFERL